MIGLIDYGSGNIRAIANILEKENIKFIIIDKPDQLFKVSKLILPGVSAFDRTMELLEERNFIDGLNSLVVHKKIPIMGICVGMQILFKKSDEGNKSGLGWIEGNVTKLMNSKTPHMGWNSLCESDLKITEGINFKKGFYFLHSYKCPCSDAEATFVTTEYDEQINAVVVRNNIIGIQFHPEKSHENGLRIFRNFNDFVYE